MRLVIQVILRDLRHAARLLGRSPGFALATVRSLALGIGAATAIFQLLQAIRLRSLPVTRPEELVDVSHDGHAVVGRPRLRRHGHA